MSAKNENIWKHPDDLIKLQTTEIRNKKLAARLSTKKNKSHELAQKDKNIFLGEQFAQKRKNPFAREPTENVRKTRNCVKLLRDDSLINRLADTQISNLKLPKQDSFALTTPTLPVSGDLALQPFDKQTFAKLFYGTDEEDAIEEQKFSKHLPMDWTLKSRVRFFCNTELPSTTLKTNELASGLTSFVRCIDMLNCSGGLDISPATRFNQATYYWQHPHIPWMKLFPRNCKENIGVTLGDRERKALAEEWDYSFRGIFQLLRSRQCPYFYLCANTFTVLFRAAGTGGRVETHALMSPSTRGMRSALRQEGIEYTMPLRKRESWLNKSGENSFTGDINSADDSNVNKETSELPDESDDDEAEEDAWLKSLEVDEKEIRRIQTAHTRRKQAQEMSEDFSDNSLLFIEGVECQGFFSFLLNAKSTITSVGRLAGVPPTLLAPVAFPKATIQHLITRSSKVRMDGVDYCSIEVKGIILPTVLPYVCKLLEEKKKTFSATLASCNNTLAFSKATQKLLEVTKENGKLEDLTEAAEKVFEQENLSDCGLLPCVIEHLCRTGPIAAGLIERVCYDCSCGYAWS